MNQSLSQTELSILDLAKISHSGSIQETFAHSRQLAQKVEELGYKRFWLAEHHNIPSIASAATSILIGHIAENTKKIRVGSGGIMLPNHSPMIIAEQFGTLAALYPNRIDLGLGRAPGGDPLTASAIRGHNAKHEKDFGDLIEELNFYFAPASKNQKVKAIPGAGTNIPFYILGSSHYSAHLSARLGLPYAFAGHFAPRHHKEAFAIYKSEFVPSKALTKPYTMLALPVIAADTDEKAEYLATSLQQAFLGIIRGSRTLTAPPVSDMDQIWDGREKAFVQSMLDLLVTGAPNTVRQKLDEIIRSTGADELIISTDTYNPDDRLHSTELIMEAKNL